MAYSYYSLITIQNGKVAADESDFAVLVSGTYDGTGGEPDIRTVANGGHVQNTDATGGASGSVTVPADLVFSPNTDGSSPYDFEIEKYNAATGLIVAWVEIPSLSSGSDTLLYMVYGDVGVAASQEDVAGTWEANFKAVYHLGEPSGTYHDSTSGNNNLTTGNPLYGYTGKIGDSISSDGYGYYIYGNNELHANSDITISLWRYRDSVARAADGGVGYGSGDAIFGSNAEHEWYLGWAQNIVVPSVSSGSANVNFAPGYIAEASGDWQLYHMTYNGANLIAYRDAGVVGNKAGSLTIQNSSNVLTVLARANGAYDLDGAIDELSVSWTVRDPDYITTTHNTHSDPSTFYTMGAEQGGGPAIVTRSFAVMVG